MNSEFVPIPPAFAARVRGRCRWSGLLSITLVVAALIGTFAGGAMLLPALPLGGVFAVVLGGLGCAFALVSAITLVAGASYVNTGYLNATYARQARRTLITMLVATILPAGIASLFLAVSASNAGVFPPAALLCLALLWLPCALALIDMIIGRSLLNPAKATHW
ncbi:hypothetical protein [Saccharopolyspora sp. NPDC049426]|uniref:hypothetical protein n=1 Tax=Saccharopolyspora sp. NPDC049426 TaxID=3155652 RepID=UPI00341DB976